VRPVELRAGQQTDGAAVAPSVNAITVELDLVQMGYRSGVSVTCGRCLAAANGNFWGSNCPYDRDDANDCFRRAEETVAAKVADGPLSIRRSDV
jgi:hypothetical protein